MAAPDSVFVTWYVTCDHHCHADDAAARLRSPYKPTSTRNAAHDAHAAHVKYAADATMFMCDTVTACVAKMKAPHVVCTHACTASRTVANGRMKISDEVPRPSRNPWKVATITEWCSSIKAVISTTNDTKSANQRDRMAGRSRLCATTAYDMVQSNE